jgi:hypothetical protein
MNIPRMGRPQLLLSCAAALVLSLALGCGEDPPGVGGDTGVNTQDDGGVDRDTGTDPGDTGPRDTGFGTDGGPIADTGVDGGPTPDSGVDGGANPNNPNNDRLDSDCDGLSDAYEFSTVYPNGQQTSASNPDSDGDGILDGLEMGVTQAVPGSGCPALADADPNTRTSPVNPDSDGDGINDGAEDQNRNGAVDADESNPRAVDSDGDGLADNVEDADRDGVRDAGELNPARRDTDGDGISDGVEDANRNGAFDPGETNALAADTDGDGLADGVEDSNQNGVREPFEIDPRTADTDCDGLSDRDELTVTMTSPLVPDTDGDGIYDGVELGVTGPIAGTTCPGFQGDANPATMTDPTSADSDNDGLLDGEEDTNLNGAVDAGETNPGLADSDGDGIPDGDEVLSGFDPLNPNDPPMNQGPGLTAVCADQNLRVVDFDQGASVWTLANELSTTYTPVTVSSAGSNVDVAAFDDVGTGMSGFILRMPLLGGAGAQSAAQNSSLESRVTAGATAESITYALRLSGRNITSHDGFQTTVSNVYDINLSNGANNAANLRNRLVRLVTNLPAGAFTGLPANTGANTAQYTFAYQLLVRSNPQELVIVGGVLPRATFDDATNNASVMLADLTNGTSLALAGARRGKDCDPFVAAGQSVADFVWMADISGSTDDDRGRITTAASLIVNALSQNAVDFRMGVVPHTENDYRLGANNAGNLRGTGFVRDPGLFATYLLDTSGNDGYEFGLRATFNAVQRALPRTAPGVENARRLRDGATLAVVYISDEYAQEVTSTTLQSNPYGYTTPCNTGVGDGFSDGNACAVVPSAAQQNCINSIAQPYINQITSNNGVAFAQVIVPNAVATTCFGYACPGGQDRNEPGLGYVEVVNATQGALYTPCNNNPGTALQAIVDAVAGAASQYQLTGSPISSTLRVGVARVGPGGTGAVDIVPRDKDDGFDYDPVSNSIFFRGFSFRPNQGDVVILSYRNWRPPEDPCGPCAVNQQCDPQLGICTCTQAACAACGANEVCNADCLCVCNPNAAANCGPSEVFNPTTCACECAPNCGGACGNGTVCNPTTCACECGPDCGGQCQGNLQCNTAACNCQCPSDCGGACGGNTICNTSTCDCACPADCNDDCPGAAACDPAQNCACACPVDCGGCPDGTLCNATSCACECAPNCDSTCQNNEVCDPNNGCGCVCPTDCGGCAPNETCDPSACRCVPRV